MLDADEADICNYLKNWPEQFISAREICRRAGGKKRFREEPNWAKTVLPRMVEKKILEADSTGHYRLLVLESDTKKKKKAKYIAPHIRKILQQSGKDFRHVLDEEKEESDKDKEKEKEKELKEKQLKK